MQSAEPFNAFRVVQKQQALVNTFGQSVSAIDGQLQVVLAVFLKVRQHAPKLTACLVYCLEVGHIACNQKFEGRHHVKPFAHTHDRL